MTTPHGQRALLIDITRCIGCNACSAACQELHKFPGDGTDVELSATAYTVVQDKGEDRYVRKMCMHCVEPSCVSVCPVGAFSKTTLGPVTYDASKCLGCRYCMVACPFGIPRYEWSKAVPEVRKCDFCVDRAQAGQLPACAEACPAEATIAGTREDLIAEAHRRIREEPAKYHPHVYGETEVGGTSVLFLSPVPFESLGFRTDLGSGALPILTWKALSKIPAMVSFGGAALFGVFWITHRRQEVAAAEHAKLEAPALPEKEAGHAVR
jgi:formate dehydrogenase iron-sulfur subunit